MAKKSKSQASSPVYDPDRPLLRDIISIDVITPVGERYLIWLSRVPCIGEEVVVEDQIYKVSRVQHNSVDESGRTFCGVHAHVDAVLQPPDPPAPKRPKRRRR